MIWLHKGQIIQHHRGARWIFQFAAPLLTSKTTLGLRKAHLRWYRVHKRLPTRNEIFNDTKYSRRKGAPIDPQIGGSRSSVRKSPIDHPVQPPAGRPAVYLKSVVDRPGVRANGTSTTARWYPTTATYQGQLYLYVAACLGVLRAGGSRQQAGC